MLLVVLVVVEKVERWCRRSCVCCRHLSLPLLLPDFGIYGQVAALYVVIDNCYVSPSKMEE
eukprot:174589-Ditylum_brightwellii.AAC.1